MLQNLSALKKASLPVSESQLGRSELLLQILSWNTLIHLVGSVALYIAISPIHASFRPSTKEANNFHALLVLLVFLPGFSLIITLLSPIKTGLRKQPQVRSWTRFYICLVTKGTNPETVLRSVAEMRHLQHLDSRIQFVVVTEEDSTFNKARMGVEVVYVPKSFAPPHARHKARALEYFRQYKNLASTDWVLHLDEETGVDEHCIRACVDFVEREPRFEWGQGIIAYNTVNYWTNPILTFAEIVRFRDDLVRFQCQHARIHVPIWGCHGSFLLTSGAIENAVTWNTECLAEDFWFANQAWYAGLGGGFISSVAREQSNWSYMDLLKQRRRWFCGMWKVNLFGKLSVVTWMLSTLEAPVALASWAGILAVPEWLIVLTRVYFVGSLFSLLHATWLQDLDMRVSSCRMLWHLIMVPVLSILANGLQMASIAYSIVSPAKGFQVVVKR